MTVHEPFNDAVLGAVTWDEGHKEWQFTITLPCGRTIPGTIVPADYRLPLAEQGLDEIRDCVRWVQDNEPAIRAYIMEQMFEGWRCNWYDEEIDKVTTPDGFREALSLAGINVLEDRRALLCYHDADLFGGHTIVLSVGADGKFDYPPNLWG